MISWIMGITVFFEICTIIGRFFWGSKQEKFKKNTNKYKIRIHHGYTGIVLMLFGYLFLNDYAIIFGWALLLSDCIHHLLVLPLWVGRTEFP